MKKITFEEKYGVALFRVPFGQISREDLFIMYVAGRNFPQLEVYNFLFVK